MERVRISNGGGLGRRAAGRAARALVTVAVGAVAVGAVAVVVSVPAPTTVDRSRPLPVELAAGEPTSLTLAADRTVVPIGRRLVLSGRLTDAATGAGVAGADVRLETLDPASGTWTPLGNVLTDSDGGAAVTIVPGANRTYRLHHAAEGAVEESTSPEVAVRVSELTADLDRTAVRCGRPVRVSGVLVAEPGSAVRLERRSAGRWLAVRSTRTAADQSWTFSVRPDAPGWWRWRVVRDATAGHQRLAAALPRVDAYRVHTYSVGTRGAPRVDLAVFRGEVAATYADPRGWRRAHLRFREVPRGGAFTVVLARPAYLPAFSGTCSRTYSCRSGRWVVLNSARWARGSPHFSGSLSTYRHYLVDHETGHWLGLGHAACPRAGAVAPVMQQQSKGMQGCRPNGWPLEREVRAVS